ncbi:Cthe_2314 family HEPN domain-containing protein [Paenibacillus cremeus]|uniref:Cthe-2314-like HEPN domain-containing protein n=1 Tax=Paenibacillus cremeus TaxID=2163881 RepID=A0A559K8R4_9BACL|nr:Cthe_2314 family HEPN domain-containing protein [Paenibacillus cremeus]TVY08516.1 hypothetical protein FPZ49_18010 [Paenibacillus cremeus]
MLRAIFGDPPRKDEGLLLEAFQSIHKFYNSLSLIPSDKQTPQERRFVIWCQGFLRAIDELEQSQYAAKRYGEKVTQELVELMSPQEKDDYNRHLYYYKNGLIRVFAILDKLGHFMNERFALKTERVKARFSFFTVLRNMHENRKFTDLEGQLYGLKEFYKDPVTRLRNQRNLEIHTINADLLDDLIQAAELKYGERVRTETEDIKGNLSDLEQGCNMTFQAIAIVFHYIMRRPPSAE